MTRQTSIEAYNTIKENGLLSARRWQVYKTVYENGPITSAEAFQIMNQGSPMRNITQSRARFTELRDMGVFTEVGKRICSVTGMTVILWDCTKNLPINFKKSKRVPCKYCDGKGFHQTEQAELF